MVVLTVVGKFSFDPCNLTELTKYIYPSFLNTGGDGVGRGVFFIFMCLIFLKGGL